MRHFIVETLSTILAFAIQGLTGMAVIAILAWISYAKNPHVTEKELFGIAIQATVCVLLGRLIIEECKKQ